MATYTDPIEKSWAMDSYEDFVEGKPDGAEIENPNYPGKIILECKLGTNKLGPSEKNWNPGLEEESLTIPGTPKHWRFEEPSTGSTYVQEAEEPFEGDDHVKLADEGPQGRIANEKGRLVLDPDEPGIGPGTLAIDADPEKTFTIRYHGRYDNPEKFGDRGPKVNITVDEDETETDLDFEPFTEGGEYPIGWARSDYRIVPSEGTPENRKLQRLNMNFGDNHGGKLGELLHQRWSIDAVSVAETFPAQAAFFDAGSYTSPTFATPPTLSKVVWGIFGAALDKPTGTDIQFEIRGYDWGTREWSPWVPIAPGENITTVVSAGAARTTDVEKWTRIQWRAKLLRGAAEVTVTPYVDSVTVNYTEQFRSDHPRIWLESGDVAAIVTKIQNHTAPGDTGDEYVQLVDRADQAFETPPALDTFDEVDGMINKYYNVVSAASFVYLLDIEEAPPHAAEDYAPAAASWVESLLDNHPFFNENATVEYNDEFWGSAPLTKSGLHNRLSWMLAAFRDWCADYLADPARAELKAKVEKTLMQVSYYALYARREYLFNPNNAYRFVWNNAAFPLFALWDNADVYDQTYAYLSDWPFLPPRQLMEEGEDKHVEDLLAYYSKYFHDGTNPEGAGYGGPHVRWFAFFYKAWKTAIYENWFTKTDLIRNMMMHELYRLQPDCTWERIAVADGTALLKSRNASERLANLGSEYDGDGDIGPVFRYMTEDILKWWPPSASEASELINRILWRDSGGTKINIAAADLPTARLFPCRGEAFMRTAWEFDPAGEYTENEYYYNFPSGTDTTAVFVAFKSGPAITGHNHCDQNTFTIFSRGNLAIDSGTNATGTDHQRNYFVRTVAHNAILIYDPDEEYPHVPKGYEDIPEELSNDGGQIYYEYEDELLRAISVNYAYFFKHKRTADAGRIERFDTHDAYDYCYGTADVAYNAYDYVDEITYQKCWLATRELVLVKPFGEYVPEPEEDTEFANFVVVYDEVASLWNAPSEGATTKWVIHAVEEPEVKTTAGWESSGAPTSGWEPENDLGVFRFNARQDVENYPGRLFGVMLLPAGQARSIKVLGGKDETNDYRFYVDGTNYAPTEEPHVTEGAWRIEIEPLTDPAVHKFLHVLWPANLNTASEAITCDLITQVAEHPEFNAAFIRPQAGEHGGTLHHVVGFFAEVDAAEYAYDVNIEAHTNHILARLQPGLSYNVVIENLSTHVAEGPFAVQATAAGVVRFDHDPVSQAGSHRITLTLIE